MTTPSIALANFACSGPVTYLGLGPDGGLTVRVSNFGVWTLCNATSSFAGNGSTYSPEGCRTWYAAILSAQKAGHQIAFYFSSAATGDNGANCSALGSWVVPNPSPYHMQVMDQ